MINFLKSLKPRDRRFYILIRSYERDLEKSTSESVMGIKDIYENEIRLVLNEEEKKEEKVNRKMKEEDVFDEMLGKWEISSSEDE